MKYINTKILLEAVNRGIKLALDNFDDDMPVSQSISKVKSKDLTSDWLDKLNMFVDLGLPSGTLWAKYNLGCDFEKLNKVNPKETRPEDWYGNYYSWGETKPKNNYLERYYKLAWKPNSISDWLMKKYNSTDKISKLLPEDDAAILNDTYKLGWHMPTSKQIDELIAYTDYKFEHNYLGCIDLTGIRLRSRINKEEIFIPAAGIKTYKKQLPYMLDNFGAIWSSELNSIVFNTGAYTLIFNIEMNVFEAHSSYRYSGFNVRPVLNL